MMIDGNYTYYHDHFVMCRNAESWCATVTCCYTRTICIVIWASICISMLLYINYTWNIYAIIHELYLKNIYIYRYRCIRNLKSWTKGMLSQNLFSHDLPKYGILSYKHYFSMSKIGIHGLWTTRLLCNKHV